MKLDLLKRLKKMFNNAVLLLAILITLFLLVVSDFIIAEVLILFPKETTEIVKINTIPSDFSRQEDLHFYYRQYLKFSVVLISLSLTGGFDTVGAIIHSVIGAQLLGSKTLSMIGSFSDSCYTWEKIPPSYDNNLNSEFLIEAQD